VRVWFYGPIKKEVGAGSARSVFLIDHDFHGFHGLDIDGYLKIGSDRIALGIEIFGFVDVNGIRQVGIPHAYGTGKVVGAVFRFTINLRVYGEIGSAGQQGIRSGNISHPVIPIYRINRANFLLGFFGTGKNQKQKQKRNPTSYHMLCNW